ncbi:hypothetical protein D3C78_1463050 [compost metagenome]
MPLPTNGYQSRSSRAIKPTSSNRLHLSSRNAWVLASAAIPFAQNSAFGPGPGVSRKAFNCAVSSLPVSMCVPRSAGRCPICALKLLTRSIRELVPSNGSVTSNTSQ